MKQNNVAEQLTIGMIMILTIMIIPIILYKMMGDDEICVQEQTTVVERKN